MYFKNTTIRIDKLENNLKNTRYVYALIIQVNCLNDLF